MFKKAGRRGISSTHSGDIPTGTPGGNFRRSAKQDFVSYLKRLIAVPFKNGTK
jgi:hypothetical protein